MKRLEKTTKAVAFLLIVVATFSCGSGTSNEKENASQDATQTTEPKKETEALSEKKALTTELIGEHSLVSISGFMGANTMIDYTLENGKWSATGSSISGGMREGYDIEIGAQDLKKLKSLKIIVNKDLTVSVSCEGKLFFSAPFNENGFSYSLKGSPKDYSSYMSEKIKPSTTFLEDYLYFYAEDNLTENKLKFAEFTEVWTDAVVIKYNVASKEFEMNLFLGECCDNSTFKFK